MASPALPLSPIVNISVLVSALQATAPTFNLSAIIGPSTRIPSVGANSRIRFYAGLAGMTTDGFLVTDPEYIAAQILFSQTPAPLGVYIGRQDLTALKTIIPHSGSAGTGYVVGDVIGVTQGGASGGFATVTTVSSGAVTGLSVNTATDGTGYSVAASLATTGGTGTGLLVDITAIGETPLVALQNCRTANSVWYSVMVTSAVTADHEAIAAFVQGATTLTPMTYFCTTGDAAVLNGTVNNLGAFLKAAGYTRTFTLYSTTQGGAFPNNIYGCAAAMGVMNGLTTGLAGSYFTMKFKQLVGVASEPLTSSQILTVEGNNVNLYLGYANSYTILEQGMTSTTNTFIDEILNRDILTAAIQFNVMNLLVGTLSVPQTDPGQAQLIHAVNLACQAAVVTGYLAPGTWTGPTVLRLFTGDPLPAGYLCQSPPYNQQSPADRAARKAVPIYCTIIEAGAVHSLTIGVYIQQ